MGEYMEEQMQSQIEAGIQQEEDNAIWYEYLETHYESILDWVDYFFPNLKTEFENHVKNKIPRKIFESKLNTLWFNAPDNPSVRRSGFFELCNLLDGGYCE